jgi:hypothetical protein
MQAARVKTGPTSSAPEIEDRVILLGRELIRRNAKGEHGKDGHPSAQDQLE